MFKMLRGLVGGRESRSGNLAKTRLSFVLVQDRTGLSPEDVASFKKEMVEVIEKYFVIDEVGLDVSYNREGDMTRLVINSPVVVRRQDSMGHAVGARNRHMRLAANSKIGKAEPVPSKDGTAAANSTE